MFNTLRYFLTAAVLVLINTLTWSQNTNISPFSRYGLGDLNSPTSSAQFSMGGIGTGYADNSFINLSNPAASAMLSKPGFDVAFRNNTLNITNGTNSQTLKTTFVSHFAYAFPGKKKYSLTAGLIPYSRVGYALRNSQQLNDTTTVNFEYKGSGGLNRAFLGQAYKLIDRKDSTLLSVGANINFLFGTIKRESRAYFPTNQNYFNTRNLSYTTLSDLAFDLGVYYSVYPNKAKSLQFNVGATFSFATSLRAIQENKIETFQLGATGTEFVVDTILYQYDDNGSVKLPQTISLGTSVILNNKLVIGIDYRVQNWSTYSQTLSNSVIKDQLKNSSQLSLGLQYTPKSQFSPNTSFVKFINYRLGLRAEKNYISINNTQLKGTAITGGIGIPLRRSNSSSKINLGYEYYTRGSVNSTFIKESYSTFMIGVSISPSFNDRWFYKRKYD